MARAWVASEVRAGWHRRFGGGGAGSYGWVAKRGPGTRQRHLGRPLEFGLGGDVGRPAAVLRRGGLGVRVRRPAAAAVFGLGPARPDRHLLRRHGRQLYHVRRDEVVDHSLNAASENRAVWAARGDQVWVGFVSTVAGSGLSSWDPPPPLRPPRTGARPTWPACARSGAVGRRHLDHRRRGRARSRRRSNLDARDADPEPAPHRHPRHEQPGHLGRRALRCPPLRWRTLDRGEQGRNAGLRRCGRRARPTPGSSARRLDRARDGDDVAGCRERDDADSIHRVGHVADGHLGRGLNGVLLHYEPTGSDQPDGGRGCKAQAEECGPGECCAP